MPRMSASAGFRLFESDESPSLTVPAVKKTSTLVIQARQPLERPILRQSSTAFSVAHAHRKTGDSGSAIFPLLPCRLSAHGGLKKLRGTSSPNI